MSCKTFLCRPLQLGVEAAPSVVRLTLLPSLSILSSNHINRKLHRHCSFLPSSRVPAVSALPAAAQRGQLRRIEATQGSQEQKTKMAKQEAPYGGWKSPLRADMVTSGSLKLGGAAITAEGQLLWLEGRPAEAGRNVVVVREGIEQGGAQKDVTPPGFNVRTRVHEYGGGALVVADGFIVFSNFADQRLYRQALTGDSTPKAVTPEKEQAALRYADGVWDKQRQRIICVREDHTHASAEPRNEIVSVELGQEGEEGKATVLVSGHDFVAFPRLSPDAKRLAWVTWSHPSMPWDKTQLWIADLSESGELENTSCIAGGEGDPGEAPTEPKWSPQGQLFFVSDRNNGFWNLYRWAEGSDGKGSVEAVYPMEAEFTHPAWLFGNSSYVFTENGTHIVAAYLQKGITYIGVIDVESKTLSPVETPYTDVSGVLSGAGHICLVAASANLAPSVVKVELKSDLKGGEAKKLLFCSSSLDLPGLAPYLSTPESISFPTKDGETAYAIFYPPKNQDFVAPAGDKPPLLVRSHGGPTAATNTALKMGIQYWTSRGWAVADVNYRGSTGYGRAYREKLYGTWGIVDVDDCCSCAEYLAEAGRVDGSQLAIDGGSAGGYTTLAVLAFRDTFKAGCSFYGVSDLMVLAQETHKFESRYLDQLLGPVATSAAIYRERSPLFSADKLTCPIILFQGLEDKVVPPNQARLMYDAVKAKGIPVALVEYEGEQHGFRKAENIKRTLEHEMLFFARVFGGFQLADPVDPLHIDNLD